jgi:DNA-binding MarR family transcriptional regulator
MNQAHTKKDVFDTIPYLLQHISSVLDRQFATELEEQTDVTLSQLRVIEALLQQPYSLQRSIADFLGQTESAISRQVAILEEQGYVVRKKNPNDSRQRIIALQPEAKQVAASAKQLRKVCYQRVLQSTLGPQNLHSLSGQLNLLHDRLCSSSPYGCTQHIR